VLRSSAPRDDGVASRARTLAPGNENAGLPLRKVCRHTAWAILVSAGLDHMALRCRLAVSRTGATIDRDGTRRRDRLPQGCPPCYAVSRLRALPSLARLELRPRNALPHNKPDTAPSSPSSRTAIDCPPGERRGTRSGVTVASATFGVFSSNGGESRGSGAGVGHGRSRHQCRTPRRLAGALFLPPTCPFRREVEGQHPPKIKRCNDTPPIEWGKTLLPLAIHPAMEKAGLFGGALDGLHDGPRIWQRILRD